MRRLPLGLLICALLMLALAGCGGSGKSTPAVATGPDPASLAPADTAVYGEALVRPAGDVKSGIETAARKVTRMQDPFGELHKAIDKASADDGEAATYAKDIEPWLGQRIGVFVLLPTNAHDDPDVGVVVAARDGQALQREFGRMRSDGDLKPGGTYRGVEYGRDKQDNSPTAVVDDFLVVGTTMHAFQVAVDTSKGSSLADSPRYQDALGTLDPDHLAFVYADPQKIATQVQAMRDLPSEVQQILDNLHLTDGPPLTLDLTAHSDEIVLELTGGSSLLQDPGADTGGPELSVGDVPGDAWLAFATPPLGPIIQRVLQQAGVDGIAAEQVRQATGLDLDADVLEPLGGLAGFARGTAPLAIGGGIVLRMRDAVAAQKLLDHLQGIVTAASGGAARTLSSGGFEVQIPASPQPVVVRAKGDRIAAGYAASSTDDLLAPRTRFDESNAGKAAIATLGEGYAPSLVLIAPPVVQLLRSLQEIDVADFSSVLPYLSAYRSLAVGTKRDGDRTTVRVVVALR